MALPYDPEISLLVIYLRKNENTRICMAESLCCSPEIITTLLINYIPIQNKKLKQLKYFRKIEKK